MRIDFRRIEISNFFSFNEEVFDFDAHKGLNLVCGKNLDVPGSKNGTGKSTLFNALVFALFGKTREDVKNVHIANRFLKKKEVKVSVQFDIDKKPYKVVSGLNKYGGPYCQLFEYVKGKDNQLEEHDLTKSTMTETRKYIVEEVLRCDISIFLRTILLSSDQNYNFFRLKKWEKKQFIEKLFDIAVFGEMYDLIHRDANENEKKLLKVQSRLIVLNKNVSEYSELLKKHDEEIQKKIESIDAQRAEVLKKKEELQKKTIVLNSDEVKKNEDVLEKIDAIKQKILLEKSKVQDVIHQLEIQLHKQNAAKAAKQSIVNKHAKIVEKLCSKCKAVFESYYSIDVALKEIDELNIKTASLQAEEDIAKAKLSKTEEQIQACDEKTEKVKQRLSALTDDFNAAEKQMQHLNSTIDVLEKEVTKLQSAVNPYAELHENALISMNSEVMSLKALEKDQAYLKLAENIVSQDTLRKFIIHDLISLLNNKIKMYLMKFGSNYDVIFDSDMNYTFMTPAGECEFDNFSSGERARMMIAACFAFRDFMHIRNSFSSNILILDEFIDGAIDTLAIESIFEILQDFSKQQDQSIYVISHRKEVSNDVFKHIIQVVKSNYISKIAYLQ